MPAIFCHEVSVPTSPAQHRPTVLGANSGRFDVVRVGGHSELDKVPAGVMRSLRLLFSDGAVGDVDVHPFLRGPVVEPLLDQHLFASVRADRARGTVVWPNGADLAPDMLRDIAQLVAEPTAAAG